MITVHGDVIFLYQCKCIGQTYTQIKQFKFDNVSVNYKQYAEVNTI